MRELARQVGMSLRAVRYHLDAMSEAEIVVAHRAGRFVRWFPRREFPASDRALISALRVRGQRLLLRALTSQEAMTFSALRTATALSSGSMSLYLSRLIDEGLLTRTGDGRYRLVDLAQVRAQLARYRVTIPDLMADVAREVFEDTR